MSGTIISHFYKGKNGKDSPDSSGGCEGVEFGFLQYHDILGAEQLTTNKIDEVLNCLRLQWQRTAKEAALTYARVHVLFLINSRRQLRHIIRSSEIVNQLSPDDKSVKKNRLF